ncbi:MAG: Bacterial alpha-L-rhamnosidase [Alphaproteobacteria bacterium]|nr:Bacterial alpha-L-rhamnosidase [Alphaproteobacteria bacterium]
MFVLKHNDTFTILDAAGDLHGQTEKTHGFAGGLVTRDTRMLAICRLTVDGAAPKVERSGTDENRAVFHAVLTADAPGSLLDIRREIFLYGDALYEKTAVTNTGGAPTAVSLAYEISNDFLDLFELRGMERKARGKMHAPEAGARGVTLGYTGLDGRDYRTAVTFSREPDSADGTHFAFNLSLPPAAQAVLYVRTCADGKPEPASEAAFEHAKKAATDDVEAHLARRPRISSSNPAFDDWVKLNARDVALLTTRLETGLFPYAGIPRFNAAFGRDAIITALQLLWQDPALAKGVLATLAHYQANETSTFLDSEPGKIMHELRLGEMAACREIPYIPYYGTADATPLFISLAGAYFDRTDDHVFLAALWPNIERALEWIDKYGDKDGDGFVEYLRGEETGLGNQGWKDSIDSTSHADGTLAEGAIALCEVQGYVYDAKKSAARIAAALGKKEDAERLAREAETLKEKFNADFWSEDLGTYALALDGKKNPCRVSTSNPGHLLYSGIVPEERAQKVAGRLMAPDMFSGWGIRTLSEKEKRYEPVKPPRGYHNGTVWVHDSAICAAGFMRYGMEDKAAAVMTALFEAARQFPQHRLPELFGGLPRRDGEAPVPYPVACSPQAWASASESMLLQSMLGIRIDGFNGTVSAQNPQLPDWLEHIEIGNLRVGDAAFDMKFTREGGKVKTQVTRHRDRPKAITGT